jgi:hypothetical protein
VPKHISVRTGLSASAPARQFGTVPQFIIVIVPLNLSTVHRFTLVTSSITISFWSRSLTSLPAVFSPNRSDVRPRQKALAPPTRSPLARTNTYRPQSGVDNSPSAMPRGRFNLAKAIQSAPDRDIRCRYSGGSGTSTVDTARNHITFNRNSRNDQCNAALDFTHRPIVV